MRGLIPFLAVLVSCGTPSRPGPGADAPAAPRPHVVYLLADDLGWKDVGWHGGTIRTPNLDALAAGGVRLEQFYVQPVCSPTRAALLTGRYPMRMGLQVHVIRPWADYGMPVRERTLPQALKVAGYRTAIVGKWHLGHPTKGHLPTSRGFDHQYGHYVGALDYFTHERDGGLDWHRNEETLREEGYTTTLIGNEAVRLIRAHDPADPLFLYVPFNAPHTPLQAPEKYLRKYASVKDKNRRAFSAMVDCLDEQVGRIVGALEEKGMRGRTLILFSSDNGGPVRQGADNGPLRAGKGTLYEGGVRVPAFANWPGVLDPGEMKGMMHVVDWYPTLLGLAGVSTKQPLPLDGVDQWKAISAGAPSARREILHNVNPGAGAVRMGDWKLVRRFGTDRSELFNLGEDPGEKNDLSSANPAKLKELTARLDAHAAAAAPAKDSSKKPPGWKTPAVWGPWR